MKLPRSLKGWALLAVSVVWATLCGVLVFPWLTAFFTALGWLDDPIGRAQRTMTWIAGLPHQSWFAWTAGVLLAGSAGFFAGVLVSARFRRPASSPTSPPAQLESRELIKSGRDLVHEYMSEPGGPSDSFRVFLEKSRVYPDLRRHLSQEYLKKLNAPRTLYVNADGAAYPPLVDWFLDELERLEASWSCEH